MTLAFEKRRLPFGFLVLTAALLALLPGCGRYMKLAGSIGRVRVV